MFASDIKIYTINATEPTKSQQQQYQQQHNNSKNNSNQQKQFLHNTTSSNITGSVSSSCYSSSSNSSNKSCNSTQKTTHQQSPQKYNKYLNTNQYQKSNSNSNNNNSNSRNSKKHNIYNKKYYMSQQQQEQKMQQQQQQRFNNNNTNNNNSLVKNQNLNGNSNNNTNINNTNYQNQIVCVSKNNCNNNIIDNVSILNRNYQNQQQQQQTERVKSYLHVAAVAAVTTTTTTTTGVISSPSPSTAIIAENFSSSIISNNNNNNNNNINVTKSSNCTSCWSNLTKLQTSSKVKQASVISSKNNDLQEIAAIKSKCNTNNKTTAAPNKRKTYWKNINSTASLNNLNLVDANNKKKHNHQLLDAQQQQQQQSADCNNKLLSSKPFEILNGAADIANINKTTSKYQQLFCKTIAAATASTAMTTALATVATATTTAHTNSSSAAAAATTAASTNLTTTKTNDITPTTTVLHLSAASTATTTTATVVPSTTVVGTVTATSSSNINQVSSSSAPTSPNSYTLDFLHSVGVQMTGGANIPTIKSNMSNMRTATYNSQSVTASPARNSYNSYSNAVIGHRQHRYMPSAGGGVGVGGAGVGHQHGGHHYQQHHNHLHQHHHHHQPQQLTIASFMQKELTDCIGSSGNSNSSSNHTNNNSNYESQQHCGNQQQQRYSNYFQQQYHHHHQQQQHHHQQHNYSTLQHAYNTVGENVTRLVSNGGGSNRQQSYSYHNNGNGGPRHQNNTNRGQQQLPYHHNIHHSQSVQSQTHYQQQQNKKPNYASSSTSSCSSSSSSSASSISSKTSGTNSTMNRQQNQQSNKKSSSNSNLAIETLPAKTNRTQHRQQHHHQHVAHHHHHQQQHHLSTATPTTPQHQNFYNLTYVATDSLAVPQTSATVTNISTTRSYSPSAKMDSPPPTLLLNFSHNTNYNNSRYQHQQLHFTQQHHYLNNQKIMLPPLSMTVPSSPTTSSTSTPQPSTIICCSQLDEATTTAAAAAVVAANNAASNESLHSIAATNSTANSPSVIAGNDCDSDTSDSVQSTTQQQQLERYKQLKSVSFSSSSSASSTTSISSAQEQIVATTSAQFLQSPIDFSYSFSLQPQQQQFHQQQFGNPLPHMSPQSAHYRNGVVSLLNLPTTAASTMSTASNNSYNVDDEATSLHQHSLSHMHPPHSHQSQQQFYFSSGEQLNIAAAPAVAAVSTGGYWTNSPNSLQHTNFLYSTTATNLLSSQSRTTSPTTLMSPRPSEQDEQQQHQQQQQQHNQTTLALTTEQQMQGVNQLKRSQFSSSTSTLQRNSQINSTGGGVLRMRGRSQQQQQQQLQTQHSFPQHNLLYNSSQHLRSSSTSSAHDFFSHTPPDRFLARAHLIEAKETPNTLLNNSKWDVLSQDIWNKFTSFQQTEETFKQKMRLWRYLYIIIKNAYPRYGLYLVGSTISGFGADTSDVDMCLVSRCASSIDPRMEALFNLTVLRDCLSKSGEFENFHLIEAKVPILRFRDRIHQLEVDLNFNNCVGIKNTHLLYCYSQLDWRLRPLVLLTKLWAQYHNINNAKNMTISSYSLVLMVIHFLQYAVTPAVLPCLHDMFPDKFQLLRSNDFGYVDMNESMGPYESKNIQTIGELFLNFLEYYSCFDYSQYAISIRTGGVMSINVCRQAKSLKNDMHQWKELCIEEPFDLTNTARSVYDFETFERVKAVFVASWRALQETLDLNSVFSPITISPHTTSINTTLIDPSTISAININTDTESELSMDTLLSEETSDKIEEQNIQNDLIYKHNKSNNSGNRSNNNNSSLNNLTSLIS